MFPALILAAAAQPGVWLDVPFFRQDRNGCGPASIAMVLAYWGRAATVAAAPDGLSARRMEEIFRAHGFRAFVFRGDWTDLEQHLAKGRPLIVALKEGGSGAPLHYVVVAGWQPDLVLINDPARRKLLRLDRAAFGKAWRASGNWTLLALPEQPR